MKLLSQLAMLSLLTTSSLAFGSSGESKEFLFTGEEDQFSVILEGEKTHTEYRTETVADTCYQEVFDHYETSCYTTSESCHEECSGNRPSNRPSHG